MRRTALALLGLLVALAGATPSFAKPNAPDTTITASPQAKTYSTAATFSFTATSPSATFACTLDSNNYSACTSPKTYAGLGLGSHTFRVRATANNVTDPSAATYSWTITAPPPNSPEGQGYSDASTPQANSQAIQSAVNYAAANNLRLDLSARTYTYAGNITIPSGVEVVGVSSDPATGTVLSNAAQTPGLIIGTSTSSIDGYRFQHLAIKGGTVGFQAGPEGPTFALFSDLYVSVPGGEGWKFAGGTEQLLFENITCVQTTTCVHGWLTDTHQSRWDKTTFRNFSASNDTNVFIIEANIQTDLRFENVTMSNIGVVGADIVTNGGLFAGEGRSIMVIGGSSSQVAGAAWKIDRAVWPSNTPFAGQPTYTGWITFKGGSWGKLDLTGADSNVLLDRTSYTALIDPNQRAVAYNGTTTAFPTAPAPLPIPVVDAKATPEAYGYSDTASGSTNAAAFSQAFSYAGSRGVPVTLKRKRYTYAGPIAVPAGVTVVGANGFGDHAQATELVNTAATPHFTIAGSNIRFEDVELLQGTTGFRIAANVNNLTFAHLSLRVWDSPGWDVTSTVSGLHIEDVSCGGMSVCFRTAASSSLSSSDFTDIYAVNAAQVLDLRGTQTDLTFAGMRMHNTCRLNPTCGGADAYFSGLITRMSVIGGYSETGTDAYTWELHLSPGSSIVFEGGAWGTSLDAATQASIAVFGAGSSVTLLNVYSPHFPVYDPDAVTQIFPAGSTAVTH